MRFCSAPWGDPNGTTLPAPTRPEDGLLALRAHLNVFANIRPVKVYPQLTDSSVLKPHVLEGVDMVVVRELTGGLYYAQPKGRTETPQGIVGVDTMRYSESEIERVLRVGFELARGRRGKLTSVDKANVLETSRLWRATATRLADEYPDVELEHALVDACAMQIVLRPASYDVIVAETHLWRHPHRRSGHPRRVHGPPALREPLGCAPGRSARLRASTSRSTEPLPTSPARVSPTPAAPSSAPP